MSDMKSPFEFWQDPPADYRGAPFWSWNSKLDPQRLVRAVESMHSAGMGGFFMHARYGLKTPYLSEEWFACISACVEKARELGMKAYLYDEDRWPSGCAGGLVTRDHVNLRSHSVRVRPAAEPDKDAEHLAAFTVELDEQGRMKSYLATEDGVTPAAGATIAFDLITAEPSPWHNDGACQDALNPKATAEFIRVTHRAYADRFGEDFGGLIPAIFMDEPNYAEGWSSHSKNTPGAYYLPWTPNLPLEFKKRRGYDIREHLPELSTPPAGDDGFVKARYDHRKTITELFVENFTEKLGKWCGKHNIALTGHMLSEESLTSQTRCIGAAMPHYEPMQWPGIDLLTDSYQPKELCIAKQCTSVADQLGKPRTITELYGCTGWDWPLEGHKFIGDWEFVCGINFRVPHLTHYSLAGGAKRDYPASIFSHSPWWNYYSVVEDYFGRLSYMLTQGTPVRDVLVIHPIESAWGVFGPQTKQQDATMISLQTSLETVTSTLSGEHYDWDFGDESLLPKYAKVSTGGLLKVGQMTYKLVVVPSCITLRSTTVALLARFVAGGGKVIFAGRQPDRIEGEPASPAIAELVATCNTCDAEPVELSAAVGKLLPRRVFIAQAGKQATFVWSMLRSVKAGKTKGQLLFVQSHDRAKANTVEVAVVGQGQAVLWDCLSGKTTLLPSKQDGEQILFTLQLPSTGSALVSIGIDVPNAVEQAAPTKVVQTTALAGPFDIELSEPNTVPLDYCTYRFGDGEFSAPMPSLSADSAIRKNFGLGTRFGREHQPWYLYATGVVDVRPRGMCQTRRTFHVTAMPKSCKLAIEQPENFTITVNGRPVGQPDGYWVDEDIKTIDITSLLQTGENEVLLTFDYRPDMELEDMYLVGDFGVSAGRYAKPVKGRDSLVRTTGDVSLIAPPTKLALGSWVGQGLDFYGGSVKYKLFVTKPADGKRLRLSLPDIACTVAAVNVNGQRFVLPWSPFHADITDALADGQNTVVVEVIGGRKNILGPLHLPWEAWTGPSQFNTESKDWNADYFLVSHGLTSPVVVETMES